MALPSNVNFGTVTGRFLRGSAGDAATDLDVTFSPGLVTPVVRDATATPPTVFAISPVTATVNNDGTLIGPDGQAGVQLIASTDPDIQPTGWTWGVKFSSRTFPAVSFSFTLGTNQNVDLASVLQVPENPGATLDAWLAAVADARAARDQARDAAAAAVSAAAAGGSGGSGVDATDVGFDIVAVLGQSNAVGTNTGDTDGTIDWLDPRVLVYSRAGSYPYRLTAAVEPIPHRTGASGVGPVGTFARWQAASIAPNRRVMIAPSAGGGTAFTDTGTGTGAVWDANGTGTLYDDAVDLIRRAVALYPHARLAAVIWVQGESNESMPPTTYRARLEELIAAIRADLAAPTLPFLIGSMNPDWVDGSPQRQAIAAVHQATPSRVPHTAYAWGSRLTVMPDGIHYTAEGARHLGYALWSALPLALANTTPAVGLGVPAPLAAPVGVVQTAATSTTGTITWDAVTGANAYRVEHVADDGTVTASQVVAATVATVTGLTDPATVVRVAAWGPGGWGAATVLQVTTGTATAPTLTSTTAPTVSGATTLAATLTATAGSWSATPDSVAYQWARDGATISGATGPSYVITTADQGHTVAVTVTASKTGYTPGTATSTGTSIPAASTGGSGTGPAWTITDTFTRADSDSLGTTETGGKTWTDPSGGVYKLQGGTAYNAFGFGTGALLDLGSAEQTVEFTAVDGAANQAYLRYTDGANWLLLGGDGTILRQVAGAQAVDTSNGPAWAAGDAIRVQLAGTAATLSINGSQVKTWTTGVTAGTSIGLHAGRFDNVKALIA